MTFDSILVLITLLVTAFTILPEHRRLELKLKIGFVEYVSIALVVVAIHYLLFYNCFVKLHLTPALGLERFGMGPKNVAYIVIVIFAITFYFRLKRIQLTAWKLADFKWLIDELLIENKHAILIKILTPRLPKLFKMYTRDTLISKATKRLRKKTPYEILLDGDFHGSTNKSTISTYLNSIKENIGAAIVNNFDFYEKRLSTSNEIVRTINVNKQFSEYIANNNPYFALDILKLRCYETSRFYDVFFYYLLANTNSVLYQELEDNQNQSSDNKYYIPERNRLLYFLFNDLNTAYEYYSWKPVGDYILKYLDGIRKSSNPDKYNFARDSYDDRQRWQCPIYAGTHFFDIMVTEAIHSQYKWHMWLYYLPLIVEKMVFNCQSVEDLENANSEFPNVYYYLTYNCLSVIRNWINTVQNTSVNNFMNKAKNDLETENGNIIKCSILAFGQCLGHILSSEKLTVKFKNDMVHISFGLYFELPVKDSTRWASEILLRAIKNGGRSYREPDQLYKDSLLAGFVTLDKIPYDSTDVNCVKDYFGVAFQA